jgi:ATP-binding cassette subfamily B protein
MGPMLIYLTAGILMFVYGNSKLTVGDITVMVTLINRLYGPVNSLFNMQVDITRSMAYCKRVFDYFDMPHEVKNKPETIAMEEISGEIEFENVDFHYEKDLPILKNVSFKVAKGSSVAVVGPSGAGKSTLINLIPRLYDATSGCVKIDGVDIKDADMFSLRKHIGFVTQDTYLFNGTVKENLLYANEEATDEKIIEACKKANLHDFLDSLPEKYETIVGNRGLKLSGGEKQRLSIARAILKDPKILLLDEATSSLDSISESLIQQAVEPLLANRTSVVIAHRLSTVMAADEIIVLDKGEITERGTHAELLRNNGVYKELYETQFRRAMEMRSAE